MNKRKHFLFSFLEYDSKIGGSSIGATATSYDEIEFSGVDVNDSSARAQCFRLLKELRKQAVDTISARRDLNIMMPSARVRELRKAGYLIKTERVALNDDQGRHHYGVALYFLVGHPVGEEFSAPIQYVFPFYR